MAMLENNILVLSLVLIMILLILLVVILFCKPWRFLSSSFLARTIKADDLERPLLTDDSIQLPVEGNEQVKNFAAEPTCFQPEGHLNPPGAHGLTHKQRVSSPATPAANLTKGGSLILDINDQLVGQTLRRPFVRVDEEQTKEAPGYDSSSTADNYEIQESTSRESLHKGSCLSLEVITGPACGLCYSVRSTDASKLPVTLGRVPPSHLVLKDSEVSGKHAMINWNLNKLKWELVDMGSLNGTLLNSKPVHHPDSGSRNWGEPKELVSGDVITLGTSSHINVKITSLTESDFPFGVGIAADPMSMRRGGKKLPMEDVCYYRWPVPGADQFGVFGICDGHGGVLAAESVSRILPDMVATILSDSLGRELVLSRQDASEVLRDAFSQTEACLNHYYEGCTATVLLVWADGRKTLFAQCANVGDSACVMNIDGKQIKMTEDHRVTSSAERQRINETGDLLKDGDTRLCGLSLGRMLGDKFLKEQDSRFSSKPYISQVVHIGEASRAFAVMASDGLWDVLSVKKAIQLVIQEKEREITDRKDSAEKIANVLLNEARTLRTKDNTSVLYIDFDSALRTSCKCDS